MLLSNVDILKAYDQGAIYFVSPGHDDQRARLQELLSHNSVDVTLGLLYMDVYGYEGVEKDPSGKTIPYKGTAILSMLSDGEPASVQLDPSSFYLAHTHEYIGTTDKPYRLEQVMTVTDSKGKKKVSQTFYQDVYLVPMFETKSTIARMGASMHLGAGFGDFGFHGRWAMEISPAVPITLNPGDKVAQISFQTLSSKPSTVYESPYSKVDNWNFAESVMPRNGHTFERLYLD